MVKRMRRLVFADGIQLRTLGWEGHPGLRAPSARASILRDKGRGRPGHTLGRGGGRSKGAGDAGLEVRVTQPQAREPLAAKGRRGGDSPSTSGGGPALPRLDLSPVTRILDSGLPDLGENNFLLFNPEVYGASRQPAPSCWMPQYWGLPPRSVNPIPWAPAPRKPREGLQGVPPRGPLRARCVSCRQ